MDTDALRRPPAADFMRVLATGVVGWYHIWQQSWVGGGRLDYVVRVGSVWVDVLILLSAFCLFLPTANDWAEGRAAPVSPLPFYRRRALRILPGYYLSLLASLIMVVTERGWSRHLAVDLAAHLTLTQMFSGSPTRRRCSTALPGH